MCDISCDAGLCPVEGSYSLTCFKTGTAQNPVLFWGGMMPRCEGERFNKDVVSQRCNYGLITLEELLVGSLVNFEHPVYVIGIYIQRVNRLLILLDHLLAVCSV